MKKINVTTYNLKKVIKKIKPGNVPELVMKNKNPVNTILNRN